MTSTTRAEVAVQDLLDLVADVWASVVPDPVLEPAPVASAWPPPADQVVSGSVAVDGDWVGDVVVSCDDAAGRRWARVMLAAEDVADDDVRESVAELANIVGGAVKAQCAGGGRLGLPVVADGPVGEEPAPDGPDVAVGLSWPDAPAERFTVVLVSR